MRTLIDYLPFTECDMGAEWPCKGLWPYRWIHGGDLGEAPIVVAYRREFSLDCAQTIRMHVSGDERYELYLDGELVGRGSERGDKCNWYYETYDMALSPGHHVLAAKVWSLGLMAPFAQMSVRHGFILAPEGDQGQLIGTGTSSWQYKRVGGFQMTDPRPAFGTGANVIIDGQAYPWGFERGEGDGWQDVIALHQGTNGIFRNEIGDQHLMRPAVLSPMLNKEIDEGRVRFVSSIKSMADLRNIPIHDADHLASEVERWNMIGTGGRGIAIPPHTKRRVIIDLGDYYCAYPQIITSGGKGSRISLDWAESLFLEPDARNKGNRDEIEGKYFFGVGDTFLPDGGERRTFKTLWWQAGRYLQLCVQTEDSPLTIGRLTLHETRYPLEMESTVACDDPRLNAVVPMAFRSLQLCAHETFLDCPYYEQLMYSGDTRLHNLTSLVSSRDERLVRKCIEVFDYSRTASGLTQSRYPSRIRQILAPFSLFWVGMLHDYALWRGDADFVRQRMRAARGILDWYLGKLNRDGLIDCDEGWNFMDWVPTWYDGVHPGMSDGPSGIMNLQFIYTLRLAADIEQWLGETELMNRWRRLAAQVSEKARAAFWDPERGLFTDDVHRKNCSEHAQCFAILGGTIDPMDQMRIRHGLANDKNLARTTISFNHYLFETYRRLGLMDLFYDRMNLWYELPRRGLVTTPEQPEPTRSDCHGWGAHPIYHFFATVLGIRPAGMGFNQVDITPNLGPLREVSGKLIHPRGYIEVDLRTEGQSLDGIITLPPGVTGTFTYGDKTATLDSGVTNRIELHAAHVTSVADVLGLRHDQ
ncbi:MAG: alpha-L-rhamnosidase [Phycisphaerales bacterium]|jgi:hypothetical protein|nr:alpha-L-rhamnosidase [Phycisphaerales bacterium]